MNELGKHPGLEPTQEPVAQPNPASSVVPLEGAQPDYMPQLVSDKAWLGVASLSVGIAGALVATAASSLGGVWTVLIAPVLLLLGSVVAIVLGHLGLRDARSKRTPKRIPITGVVIGYVLLAIFVAIVVTIGVFAYLIFFRSSWG